ncbi:MAG: PD-(D/E)XK nuclease family protein, partial [Bradyrhizobium sp.]|nr:PD-(D/E)XK nuclease family protein [Bradyrhizobium sp.]
MTEALTVYRRSALEDSDCLHRLKALWLDGVPDDSDYALFGQAFHKISHRYVLRLVARGLEADADEARAAFAEGIASHQTPTRLIPELRELWMRHAEVFTLDLKKFLAAEQRLELHGVSGALDLVYADPQTLEVIDWKTFHVMLTETEARQSFQARIYTLLARERFPNFPMYRFTFWFVRFNKAVSVVFTPADL